jgi:large subunit ribosomal protein L25
MKHTTPKIAAQKRSSLGTHETRRLRQAGRLPAVIYGGGEEPAPISVDNKEMLAHIRHGMHVITVEVEGARPQTVLVKELQFGYLGDDVIHVDLTRVGMEDEVRVHVHLNFVGQPKSAAQAGSIMTHDLNNLEVICRVDSIPGEIRVDLMAMGEATVLTVGSLVLPPGVRTAAPPETVVAHVTYIKREEEAVGEEAVVTAAPVEPEVITARKETEEAEEKK